MEIDPTNTVEYSVPEQTNKVCAGLYERTQAEAGEWKDIILVAGIDQHRFHPNLKMSRILVSTTLTFLSFSN